MSELTKIQKAQAAIVAFVIVALLLFGCYCAFGAMRWALVESIDLELDAHSASAFPEYVEGDFNE